MTVGSILLGTALLLLVVLFLARPFLRTYWQPATQTTSYNSLLTEKETLLNQIRALDFDHETGKMPTAVYQSQRQRLIGEAAIILEQMDSFDEANSLDAEIEAAIAQHRQVSVPATEAAANRYCPNCGQPIDADDNFCAACGHKLSAP